MPTHNPRITITLRPSSYALLLAMSKLSGNSQSGIVAELLEGLEPVFERTIKVMEAAVVAKDSVRANIIADVEAAQSKMEAQFGIFSDQFDAMTLPIIEGAETIKRRGRKRPAGNPQGGARAAGDTVGTDSTPPSNRGVRYSTPHGKKHSTLGLVREKLSKSKLYKGVRNVGKI